jgi:hypothetical protein
MGCARNGQAKHAYIHTYPSKIDSIMSDNKEMELSVKVLSVYKKMVKEDMWRNVSEKFMLPNEDIIHDALDGEAVGVLINELPNSEANHDKSFWDEDEDEEDELPCKKTRVVASNVMY